MAAPLSSGSGSGSPGGTSVPLQREVEATAWTEINKAALGIVQDSIEISFSQLNQRYSTSHMGTETGYRSRENQPMLDHFIETARTLLHSNQISEDISSAAYHELVNQLSPPELQQRFLEEAAKPIEERSSDFTAADNLLKATAHVMVRLAPLSSAAEPGSLEETHTALNLLAPFAELKGAERLTNDALNSAENLIRPGNRHFDEVNGSMNQMRNIIDDLNTVNLQALLQLYHGNG